MNINLENIKVILWDFDGVIMASNEVRDSGFEIVLADYPKDQVDKLLAFHRKNGGLSRYVKFRHFFEEIRGEPVTETEVKQWAQKFSEIMLITLKDESLLISETVDFIRNNYESYDMYVVSGSDQKELREICTSVGINKYFNDILGSPTPKKEHVKNIILKNRYRKEQCVLIGDSINDYDAAEYTGIRFFGYGDKEITELTTV